MDTCLNFMGPGPELQVISIDNYKDVFKYWFPMRKKYYEIRVERTLTILRLKILLLENTVRYIEKKYKFSTLKVSEMEKILTDDGFDKLNKSKINNPDSTPTEKLYEVYTSGKDTGYGYLIDLSDRDKSEENLIKYKDKLLLMRTEYDDYLRVSSIGRFKGAYIWEKELADLQRVIEEGFNTNWKFEDHNKYQL